jgi:hypothetical protein
MTPVRSALPNPLAWALDVVAPTEAVARAVARPIATIFLMIPSWS